jgi:hypothetical protein
MNFEFGYLNAIVFLSWLFTADPIGLVSILLGGAILFSASISVNLLLLLTLTLISFIIAMRESKRSTHIIAQKYYTLRLLGVFIALVGLCLQAAMASSFLIALGLVITLPSFFWSVLFKRHYESMSVRAYLYSIVLPALVVLNILFKIKAEVKVDFSQAWDILFTGVGLATLLFSSIYAFTQQKTKSVVIYLTQAWIGLGLFLLVMDTAPFSELALSSLLSFALTGALLFVAGKRGGKKSNAFSRAVMVGLPGFLGYTTYYYSIKSVAGLQVNWIWAILVAYLFQILALMMNDRRDYVATQSMRLRFWLIAVVQCLAAAGFFALETWVMK